MSKQLGLKVFLGCLLVLGCPCVKAENLLKEDPFYQKSLPKLLGKNFKPHGTYRVPFYVSPNHFHPFSNDPFVSSLWNLCTGSLSKLKLGCYQTMAPSLASKIEKKVTQDGVDYWVELKEMLFWEPIDPQIVGMAHLDAPFLKRKRVESADFKLYLELIKNPFVDLPHAVNKRPSYASLESIEVLDARHFIVHWKGQELLDQAALTGELRPLPSHVFLYGPEGQPLLEMGGQSEFLRAKHFMSHWAQKTIVSCGPWIFKAADDDAIELIRNSSYPDENQALFEKMYFRHKGSPNSAWQSFKLDELDSYTLTPNQWQDYHRFLKSKLYLKQIQKRGAAIEKIEFLSKIYYFIGWNQKKALFQDPKVRRALSYAIDCDLIIEHFLKGFAKRLSGPFMPGGSSYNESIHPIEKNKTLACELLEEAGWHLKEPMGIRVHEQTQKPFQFRLTYFLRNELAQSLCQYIATSLREVGIECFLEGLDYTTFMEHYQKKEFDALYMAWSMGSPPEDPEHLWSSYEADKEGSSNLVGFKNEEVDRLIEHLKGCRDLKEREKDYHRIHEIIAQEQPYTFLYVPTQIFLYRSRLGNVFVPKECKDLISFADIEEPCPRIFYFRDLE